MNKITLTVELTQAEALALQNALDSYIRTDNSEPEMDMVDKVSKALVDCGYDPDEASKSV